MAQARKLQVRVVREPDQWPEPGADLEGTTASERLDMVWAVSLRAYEAAGRVADQRLKRDVVRVTRREG